MKRVDIPEMGAVFEEMDWYKAQIESATAATPVVKGETEEGDQTKYEIQTLAAAATKRITSGAPLAEQYWQGARLTRRLADQSHFESQEGRGSP